MILNEAQQQRLREFRGERAAVRKELRVVRHDLRKDIETLEGWLKFANIGLVPLLITIIGLLALAWKLHRRQASVAGQSGPRSAGSPA